MPTYAYRCASCEHSFEQYQAFTDDALTECPSCGAAELRKVFNSIGVTFKGSGFYRTDSRAGASSTSPATSSSETGSKSGSGSGSTSGAKSSDGASSSTSSASKPAPAAAPSNA